MLRCDLAAANIPFKIDSPEGEETRDFHALRGCYISNIIRAGAELKQAMTLARHSDPKLTTARYARTRLHDHGALVNKLPNSNEPETARLWMTGTDGEAPFGDNGKVATGVVKSSNGRENGGSGRLRLRINEDNTDVEQADIRTIEILNAQAIENDLGRVERREDGKEQVPSARIERATPSLGNAKLDRG